MSRKAGSIGPAPGSRYARELSKLVEEYERLSRRVMQIAAVSSETRRDVKALNRRLTELENILVQTGVIAGAQTKSKGRTVRVYFWLTKSGFKEAQKEGLYPIPFVAIKKEHACFYSIMRAKGYNFPEEVILGRLNARPTSTAQTALSRRLVYAQVGVKYVWVGDASLLDAWSEETEDVLRIDYCKEFADTVEPVSAIIEAGIADVSKYVAMVSRHIKPGELVLSTEHYGFIH